MENVAVSTPGRTPEGRCVERYTLRNAHGLEADIMTYGATLMALRTPDREGRFENLVLGFDTLEPYLAGTPYFGATIGRYANRIAGARFTLDGREYKLTANDGRNQLHGGAVGFDKVVWEAFAGTHQDSATVAFAHFSPDGDQGYPGAMHVDVVYQLTDRNCLSIDYFATTTKPTHVNLTHHSYFNLTGDAAQEITSHELIIDAEKYLPVDAELIPTGELRDVAGDFDFRAAHVLGSRIEANDAQLRIAGGYDHTFVLNKPAPGAFERAGVLSESGSGRVVEVWTTEPGLQFYSGNNLAAPFARRTGVCLEPQHFPNTPNTPTFPSTVLLPGHAYRSRTEFRFSVAP